MNLKLPQWYQVAQRLRAEIASRSVDDLRLPTERELAERFGVSLITVRQALTQIQGEGLITRFRRRGTFINPAALGRRPLEMASPESVFVERFQESTVPLERKVVDVPPEFRTMFAESEVMMFSRLRLEDEVPVSVAINYVRRDLGERISLDMLDAYPMPRILRDELGVRIKTITDTVEARGADDVTAGLLKVAPATPVLLFTGVVVDDADSVIDVASISFLGDRYKFGASFNVN